MADVQSVLAYKREAITVPEFREHGDVWHQHLPHGPLHQRIQIVALDQLQALVAQPPLAVKVKGDLGLLVAPARSGDGGT